MSEKLLDGMPGLRCRDANAVIDDGFGPAMRRGKGGRLGRIVPVLAAERCTRASAARPRTPPAQLVGYGRYSGARSSVTAMIATETAITQNACPGEMPSTMRVFMP